MTRAPARDEVAPGQRGHDNRTMPAAFTSAQSRPLIRAVLMMFFVNGVMMGTWGGSLPGLRDRVGTDAAGIGVILFVSGLSGIVSMQIGWRISDRVTPRAPALVSGAVMSLGLLAAAVVPSYPTLVLTAVLVGAGNGTMDVAMNALGVEAEKAAEHAVMSRFHAFFSLGGFVGAALVLLLSRLQHGSDVDPRAALLVSFALAVIGLGALARMTPRAQNPTMPDVEGSDADGAARAGRSDAGAPTRDRAIPLQAWLLGIMALFFGFTEGTAVDWASIHVTDVAHVDPGVGAAGLVCVSATMVAIRLVGDALVGRFGRSAVVRCGAPVAVVGFAVTMAFDSLPVILVGWLLVGLGVGMIAPQIYAIAGHIGGGRVLALVTGFGYTAFLAGPGLMGVLSGSIGIQKAMALPLLAGLLLTALTFTKALRDPEVEAPRA